MLSVTLPDGKQLEVEPGARVRDVVESIGPRLTRDAVVAKLEIISGLEDGDITVYRQGDFFDLCRGPHVPSTGKLGAFKLQYIAGAYWRGDEKNPMLTR